MVIPVNSFILKLGSIYNTKPDVFKNCLYDIFGDMILTYEIVASSNGHLASTLPISHQAIGDRDPDEVKRCCAMSCTVQFPPFAKCNQDGSFTVSNKFHFLGASVILYPNFMQTVAVRTLSGSFWMIPFSIYEWIFVPEDKFGSGNTDAVIDYWQNLGKTDRGEAAFLSDTLYHYDVQTQMMEPAKHYSERILA